MIAAGENLYSDLFQAHLFLSARTATAFQEKYRRNCIIKISREYFAICLTEKIISATIKLLEVLCD